MISLDELNAHLIYRAVPERWLSMSRWQRERVLALLRAKREGKGCHD